MCLWRTQWSLYLTAAYFVPLAALFLIAKPNIALAILSGLRSRRQLVVTVIAGVVLVVVALLARGDWIGHWISALLSKEFVSAPISNPGGFLLLLSLLRWRRPEARVFAALVAIPQTPSFYDLVPLIVIARNMREVSFLSLLTSILFCAVLGLGPAPNYYEFTHRIELLAVWIVYLPALVMLLRRPNVSEDPPGEPRPRKSPREWIESLPRLDFWLLLLNGVFAVAYLWGFLTTTRA
jgi:hypothetical protein